MTTAQTLTAFARYRVALPLAAAAILAWPSPSAGATGPAIPFPIADIFFEFNAVPNDLGVHIFLDAKSWRGRSASRVPAPAA